MGKVKVKSDLFYTQGMEPVSIPAFTLINGSKDFISRLRAAIIADWDY